MSQKSSRSFYVGISKKNGLLTGYGFTPDPTGFVEKLESSDLKTKEAKISTGPSIAGFETVFRSFVSTMDSYRGFIPLTFSFAPLLSSSIIDQKISKFSKTKGVERPELSSKDTTIYEINMSCYREFSVHYDESVAMNAGARHLPEIMVLGLVSSYDAFLSQLLLVILHKHAEIVLTSEKSIKFSELSTFNSIDEARDTLIEREIESVIRMSHHEQFNWMEDRLSIKLREGLRVWPRFIELCERRNFLTHSGGVVSTQYLQNCEKHKCDIGGLKAGERLTVDSEYFSASVGVTYEIGVKLSHVFWRKFFEEERDTADFALNELCFNLIYGRAYELAESLLLFGTKVLKKHASDRTRRMMVINLANAIRLQNNVEEAKKVVEQEDWSSTNDVFKVSVAAVRGDVDQVIDLMSNDKNLLRSEQYRTWPVFRGMETDERFLSAFEATFGEPLLSANAVQTPTVSDTAHTDIATDDAAITKH